MSNIINCSSKKNTNLGNYNLNKTKTCFDYLVIIVLLSSLIMQYQSKFTGYTFTVDAFLTLLSFSHFKEVK
jgi:hypothetical protein